MNKTEAQNMLSSLLDTPIVCNRIFAEITGSLSAGTLLTFLIKNSQSGFSRLIDAVELRDDVFRANLSMSTSEIYSAKRQLKQVGFVETKIQGHPIKTLYTFNGCLIQEAVVKRLSELKKPPASITKGAETYVQQRCNSTSKDIIIVSDTCKKKPNKEEERVKENKERSRKRKELDYKEDDTEYQLAKYLHDQIVNRRPNFFGLQERSSSQIKKKIKNWAKEMDFIIHPRNDGRDPEEALDVLVWSQKDIFWQKVITSPYKLREKYGQLLDYKESEGKNNQTQEPIKDTHPETTNLLIQLYSKEFLGGKIPDWPPTDKGKFIRASRKISTFAKEADLSISNVPGYVIRCLKSNFANYGKAVHPGNLCSDNTWNILMPQYLNELGITYKRKQNE